MRTALFLVSGVLLIGGFLLLSKIFASQYPEAPRVATLTFVVVWFVIAALNMWLGVAKAGYSVAEELPIFLLIFVAPVALAGLIKWQLL
jgi:CHASE1-domain containing sensor protein